MPAIKSIFSERFRIDRCSSAKAFHRLADVALILATCVVAATDPANAQSQTIDLSGQPIGAPPQDFEFWRAGEGDSGHWTVERDGASDSSVSVQRSGGNRDLHSSLAACKTLSAVNARIRVQFKLIDGSMPSAGIAVRVTSPNDYYLVRVSAFEQRLSLLHVVNGMAEEVAGVDADITLDHWQSLEVVVDGNSFKMSLDNRWALTAFDYGKPAGGHFGIWTERDDVTRFNQIEITPLTYVGDDENLRNRAGGESRTE
ncbi:hypothetical protein SAMN05443247_03486 [Bradyrhizobium erythrophlei]|jgi:hypothetical protein|nr:hypothetical protein SAMN05443247_03486 [Bradyrhizobium erythrophlei]